MALTSGRRQEISQLANVVRTSLELRTPLNVNEAVTQLGGHLEEVDENYEFEAWIRKQGDSFVIATKRTSPVRFNFTVAHELGHLFLHMGYIINPQRWNLIDEYIDEPYYRHGYNTEEYEANEFAAELLMPRSEFIKAVFENIDSPNGIEKIANIFHVSKDAAENRKKWLMR